MQLFVSSTKFSAMGAGFDSTIDIYLRVRPISSGAKAVLELNQEEGRVTWTIPRHVSLGLANHQREHFTFKFTGLFDMESKQDEVFQKVAHKVVIGSLDGYNGTIFAYGQTGSGKTYTITGGSERYVDRGIIPRTISLIFSEIAERSEYAYTLHFSYMEVYNETGYDLLNPDHETKALEDLPKVTLLEDDDNVFHFRNLSHHLATNEEEALNLVFVGDTNRIISSTPMNMASSRSHCIFTAHILACKVGEETVRKSKLHLVDLAGSERVWKTGVDGQILREAKYINLSLHYLEQVIVALQEKFQGKMRTHIPYRNSMMTSVLRDSIGGNCLTVMIATVTIAQDQLPETISTCRFAQRVAMISNQVTLNEEVDPNLLIKRLKQQIGDLKGEIALLRGENENRPPLSASEIENVRSRVIGFLSDKGVDTDLHCGGSMMHIHAAFQILKEMLKHGETQTIKSVQDDNGSQVSSESTVVKTLQVKVSDLQYQLQQRDNEIQILVAFIRKREAAARNTVRSASVQSLTDRPPSTSCRGSRTEEKGGEMKRSQLLAEKNVTPRPSKSADFHQPKSTELDVDLGVAKLPVTSGREMDKDKAFELFSKGNDKMEAIEENKSLLIAMCANAKALGEKVNRARDSINGLRAKIEKHRVERARDYLVSGVSNETLLENDEEEDQLLCYIDAEKRTYKEGFSELRDIKKEIEHLHKLLEHNGAQLQADFEVYWSAMTAAPASTETSRKAPIIPRLQISSAIGPQHQANQSSSAEYKPLFPFSSNSLSARGSHCSPLSVSDPRSGSRGGNDLRALALASSKEHSKYVKSPSSSGAGQVLNNLDNLLQPIRRQQLKESVNTAGLQKVPLTGNAAADADIIAFYKARSGVLKKVSS
ncbi:uncharacterized protein [Physcomitrium patens]|uniref:uncharacterized protein isoform X2 n=1 Tax=Physcomitrium patens TaxID=3218 RepID=UPI003CCCF525